MKLWLIGLALVSVVLALIYCAVAEILFFSFENEEPIPSSFRTMVCALLVLSALVAVATSYFATYEIGKLKEPKERPATAKKTPEVKSGK